MRVNDFALPVIHERRRFTDMMDEEIDDEATQGPVLPDHRMSISYNAATGVSILKLDPAHRYDCGVYKAVARNLCYSLVQKEASANDWTNL